MATKKGLLKIIRQNCSECMGGPRACDGVWPIQNPSDVSECPSVKCAFFDYRMGDDPVKNPLRVEQAKRNFGSQTQE